MMLYPKWSTITLLVSVNVLIVLNVLQYYNDNNNNTQFLNDFYNIIILLQLFSTSSTTVKKSIVSTTNSLLSSSRFISSTSNNSSNIINNDSNNCTNCLVTKDMIQQYFLPDNNDQDDDNDNDMIVEDILRLHNQLAQKYHVIPIQAQQKKKQQQQDNNDPDDNETDLNMNHNIMNDIDDDPNCPCSNKEYCYPITGIPPVNNITGEMYGFYAAEDHTYFNYNTDINFTYITSIAWAYQQYEIICIAHQYNVRVIDPTPSFNLTEMYYNITSIYEWIYSTLSIVQKHYRDGVVFDYESPLLYNSIEVQTYVKLINYTRIIFQLYNPSYQITTCIPWSPDSIDGRSYPFIDITNVSDIVYAMVYDVQSQIYTSTCIANANSPYYAMIYGISRYIEIGMNPKKMILGIPWYGYRYPCISSTSSTTSTTSSSMSTSISLQNEINNNNDRYYCTLEYHPFRGIPCSDAIGREYDYSIIMDVYYEHSNSTIIQWDDNTKSPYFTIIMNDTTKTTTTTSSSSMIYQYWFDNSDSLRLKYQWAKEQKLLGVGPFTINNVNYHTNNSKATQNAIDMWSALDAFYL